MRKHKSAWPFQDPVNRDDVPDYYDVIANPIGKYSFFIIDFIVLILKFY